MEEKRRNVERDKEIVFSQSVKAGKRIYYLDVKRSRNDELFLAITESKKVFSGEGEDAQMSFEKHKIFLYKEDFDKFTHCLQDAIGYIRENQAGQDTPQAGQEQESALSDTSDLEGEIKLDIDF